MTSARVKRSGSSLSRVLRCLVTASASSVRASMGTQLGPRTGADEVSAMRCTRDLPGRRGRCDGACGVVQHRYVVGLVSPLSPTNLYLAHDPVAPASGDG